MIQALMATILAVAAFSGGWIVNGWRLQTQILTIEKSIADANAEAEQNLNAANVLGNQLTDAQIQLTKLQHDTAIKIKEKVVYVEKSNPAKCDLANVRVLINAAISNKDSATSPTSDASAAAK